MLGKLDLENPPVRINDFSDGVGGLTHFVSKL